MSYITNQAINSRSMNGILTITDGTAILEDGDLTCQDINSKSLTTDNINTNLLSVTGEFRCNLNGPLSIPTSISNEKGLLISYGNTTNSGATDFTNFGSTYTSTQQGFRFFNKSNTQTLTNLAIIENTQTYFKSQLVGCLAETPVNPTSVANKTYIDSNFVDRTNNLTQNINGLKTFTNNTNFTASLLARTKMKLYELVNVNTDTTLVLTFPLSQTTIIRPPTAGITAITIQLPALSANEIGMVFSFVKIVNNLNVTLTASNSIFVLNDLVNGPTTNTTLLSSEKMVTTLAVGFFNTTYYWIEVSNYSTFDRNYNNTIYGRLASPNAWTNTNTFNSFLPTSTLTPSTGTQLITKNFSDATYIDFTTDQQISATNKRFNGLFTTGLSITPTVGGAGNRQQIYMTGTELSFNPLFHNNYYRFYCRTNSTNQINPLEISYNSTTINNNLISNAETFFNTWVSFKFRTRIFDLNGLGNYTQMYMIGGNEFVIGPNANGDKISFYCKDATLGQLNTFISSALGNTSNVNLTCSASLISNNLLATTSSIAGTNNLYTNLDPVNGFGVVNFGTRGNNINIKCNLNINESAYGTTQNTVVNMEGNSMRFTNNGSTNGNYIFTINESGTYNTLVINETSVNIARDANINGDLTLYDTTPSTKTISASLVNNDFTFNPNNTVSTTYNFKTNDSIGTLTIPLIINSTNTTISNNLISNSQATFNNRLYATNKLVVGVNGNTGLNLEVLQQLYLYSVNYPFTDYARILNVGGGTMRYHSYSPIQGYSSKHDFYSSLTGADDATSRVVSFETGAALTKVYNTFEVAGKTTFNAQTTFNTNAPISNTAPTLSTYLTTKNYTDSTFQAISNMVNYLTTATASATYQTIAGMSSYLTTATASATYQTISGMSNYLTKTETNALMPVGSIHMMAMGTIPTGFLECNGQSVSISTYPALSAYLNFTYGGSSGSGLFQVPDFRGMFLRGKGTNGIDSNYASSSSYGLIQTDGIKSHTHNISFGYCPTASTSGGGNMYNSTAPNYNNPAGLSTGQATGFTDSNSNPYPDTRPGNFPVLYCIKY